MEKERNFYRKYRPKKFSEIYGQEQIVTILKEQVNRKKTHFAYLFTGIHGVGKTSTARILSKAINCLDNKMGEICEKCKICILNKEQPIDIYEIDAASNNGVEQIRSLKEKALISPLLSNKKIYIIDEVHMLSKSAYNAFLKLLEEPPFHVVFILATTQIFKISETILSRCQIFEFHPLNDNTLINLLNFVSEKEGIIIEEKALKLITKKTKGSVREALNILEQISFLNKDLKITEKDLRDYLGIVNNETINNFILSLLTNEKQKSLEIVENLFKIGLDLKNFYLSLIEKLTSIIFDKFLEKKIEEDIFKKHSIESLKVILDLLVKRYSEFINLNILQVLRLIILENWKIDKKEKTIIKKQEIGENKINLTNETKKEDLFIKSKISKCIEILKERNKDLLEFIKINWNIIANYLEHDIYKSFAKLLINARVLSVSDKNEILIKVKTKKEREKLNILSKNKEYLKFIEKIFGKKFKIFTIDFDEVVILKQEFNKLKNE